MAVTSICMDYFPLLRNFLPLGRNTDSYYKYKISRTGTSPAPTASNSSCSSVFPGIHALPVEILQDIFIDFCTIDIQQYAEDAKRYKREFLMFPPFHPDQLRCRLSLVCRRWASILKKTPQVWTQLVFLDYIPHDTTIKQWLKWSEPLPLELLILLWDPQRSTMVEDSLRLLSPNVSRFRFLMAEFSRNNQFRDYLTKHLFPVGQVIHMPELKFLHLHQFFPPPTLPAMGSIVSPRLLKLCLISGYQSGATDLVGERLEHVHFVLTENIAKDFKFLFKVKQLRALDIEFHASPTTVLNTVFRPLYLTTLKLAIHFPSHVLAWDNVTAIFDKFDFPALENLDISVTGYLARRDASPSIRSLVIGKSHHIQEFLCAHLTLGPDFYNTLAHLGELKRISLSSCILEENFFQRFMEDGGYLCPALEEIQLAPCVKFSTGCLEQLLRLRADIVVLVTSEDIEMGVNDSTALISLQETYPQFALRVNAINLWTTNEYDLSSLKYLGKAFSKIGLLSRPDTK